MKKIPTQEEFIDLLKQLDRSELDILMYLMKCTIVAERKHIDKALKLVDELRHKQATIQDIAEIETVIESEGYSVDEELEKILADNSRNSIPG